MTDKLDEMWKALEAYQPRADADGHGESWALMCSERTEATAYAAVQGSWDADTFYAAWAAEFAAWAADDIRVECYSERAIDYINKAQGETK
jgi:hypothetical protein